MGKQGMAMGHRLLVLAESRWIYIDQSDIKKLGRAERYQTYVVALVRQPSGRRETDNRGNDSNVGSRDEGARPCTETCII